MGCWVWGGKAVDREEERAGAPGLLSPRLRPSGPFPVRGPCLVPGLGPLWDLDLQPPLSELWGSPRWAFGPCEGLSSCWGPAGWDLG